MLQTRYRLDPLILEAGGGEVLVETAGYVPADIRIKEFIDAGIRLGEYRKEAYDFGAEEEVDFTALDVFRAPSTDMAEVSSTAMALGESLRKKRTAIKLVKEEKEEEVPPKDDEVK